MQVPAAFLPPDHPALSIVRSAEEDSATKFADFEFSEYQRDPRFAGGLWFVPTLVLGGTFWGVVGFLVCQVLP